MTRLTATHARGYALSARLRDAKLPDLIAQPPGILDERQLGPLVDKDPAWRNAAVFASALLVE